MRVSPRALPWTVDVYDAVGNAVASSSGLGTNVDWSWDATTALPGSYSYSIRSDAAVTPAFGPIGGGAATLGIAGLAADPETVSPNTDSIADLTTITYTLSEAANVTVTLRDGLGAEVATVVREAGSGPASTLSASIRRSSPTVCSRSR